MNRYLLVAMWLTMFGLQSACSSPVSQSLGPKKHTENLIVIPCNEFEWHDIAKLVAPYQSDALQVALIQQGQSSGYRLSAAAEQALADGEHMPSSVKVLLQSIVDAGC
ncbi:hypothetical protein [Paraglaciecola sp. 2405UD69-4]|uniref:hypothetical protein n=1 Tax=Paraglaciecola sp. 2405UD69-4 TaxID=3391836 RepID=UPI0039C909CD